ncbi:F5D14.10 protein [Citrus sinensis]|uniref:F5D14.10 protein n=1 Tax=Citrus sinensis TaxID=2711 RepID=A0ACB8K236_CITSI|nr:F5D14.10 protein [Citrus sinensis]
MRRTRRGGGRPRNHLQNDEDLTVKPLNDAPPAVPPSQQKRHQQHSLDSPSTSDQPNNEPIPKYQGNLRWVSRRRRARVAKPKFVKKTESREEKLLNDEVGSLSIGEEVKEKQDEEEGLPSNSNVNDVESILRELNSSFEEPELEAEQLRINDQSQGDELLALESIYGDNVFILDRQRDLRSCQIHVHVETLDGLTVTAKLNSSTDLDARSESSDDFSYSFKVQYLPPIVLTCLLPKSYPSHLPPYFTISARWLNSTKISNLCSMLESIWIDQPGQEILYQWIEWLQNSSLSYLGFSEEIVLGPYGVARIGDRRAISESVSPDVDIPSIRSYNDERCHENFLKSFHECRICFSEFAGTDFVRLPCHHFFCWKCMKTYLDIHISEGTVSKLQCPDAKCGGMVPPSLLKKLLGDEEFERWESLMLQKTLESMSDVAYCPRCETPCIEDEEQHAQCSKCFYSFCTLCRERRHVGVVCMTPEIKLRILQERQNSSQVKEGQKQREREMINELLSVKEILRDAKQCPSCKMAISRTEGCNKIVCNNCGQYFCYRCNKAIDGYDHFRTGTCELFPLEMIRDWEERLNARQVVAQIQADMFDEHGLSCPNCRQFNAKHAALWTQRLQAAHCGIASNGGTNQTFCNSHEPLLHQDPQLIQDVTEHCREDLQFGPVSMQDNRGIAFQKKLAYS